MNIKLLALINNKNFGDDNNAKAITLSLLTKLKGNNLSFTISEEIINTQQVNLQYVIEKLNKEYNHKIFVIGAGEHQLQYFQIFKQSLQGKIINIWLSHQPTEKMRDTESFIDHYALPECLINELSFNEVKLNLKQFINKILPLELIPHDKTHESIKASFVKIREQIYNLPANTEKNIIVILGGDAPLPGNMDFKFFTEKEAKELADKIIDRAVIENRFIYITNGPRTGAFDHVTKKEIASAHRITPNKEYKIDSVTTAFIKQLKTKGFEEGSQFKLFDFKRLAEGGVESSLTALYYYASVTDSIIFVPGESMSSISEVVTLGLYSKMEIYHTGSMNEYHEMFAHTITEKDLSSMPNPVDQVVDFVFQKHTLTCID